MRIAGAIALAACLLAGALATDARAERLIASVSNHRVTITPDYSGERAGAVRLDRARRRYAANRGSYDLVVTVSGPRMTMVTRRKEKKLGIWINTDSREFINVPAYLAVFANRPINLLAAAEVQRRQQLGLNNIILTQRVAGDFADVVPGDPFRAAFIRLRTQHGLYREVCAMR